MPDIVDTQTRSRMMSGIRGKNTRPEVLVRSALHRRGYRFRIHVADLPGKPDIVLPKYRAVILINGCFWHCHGCHLFKWPSTRTEWWQEKLNKNVQTDIRSMDELRSRGWRVATVWECALKGRSRRPVDEVIQDIEEWLGSTEGALTISGTNE